MNKYNQLKAGALLSYVNLGISTVIPLLYTPVMLRILGQAEYGLYSLSNSVISYLSLLTLGLGSAILRYLTRYRTENNKVMLERTAGLFVVLYIIIAIVTCAVGFCLTFFTGSLFARGLSEWEIKRLNILIVIMTLSAAVSLISGVYSSLSICYERYVFRKLMDIAATVATPILNLAVLYAGYASIGMATIGVAAQIITLVINIWYCVRKLDVHPRIRNLPLALLKDVFSFTAFVFIGMIADLLYWSTDKILIGALIGSTAVAVYNVGSTFNSILQSMSAAISNVFGPRINQLVFSNHNISEISELLIRIGRVQYLIVSLVLSGFIAFGTAFIRLWAGEGYTDAYAVALLTMIPLAIPLIQNIAFTTITAQNRHQFRSILYVVLAVANVIGTYLLIPSMGIIGAALCTCIVFVLGHGISMNWFYYKKIGLDILAFWKNIFQMSFVPAGMLILFFFLQHYGMKVDSLSSFFSGVVIYTVIFCLLSWLFTMNRYEKDLVLGLFRKVLPQQKKAK